MDDAWYDRGHLRDGIVYCTDPDCLTCRLAIDLREKWAAGDCEESDTNG